LNTIDATIKSLLRGAGSTTAVAYFDHFPTETKKRLGRLQPGKFFEKAKGAVILGWQTSPIGKCGGGFLRIVVEVPIESKTAKARAVKKKKTDDEKKRREKIVREQAKNLIRKNREILNVFGPAAFSDAEYLNHNYKSFRLHLIRFLAKKVFIKNDTLSRPTIVEICDQVLPSLFDPRSK